MSDDWRRRHPAYDLDEPSDDIDRSLDRAEQDDYAAQDAALQQTADAAARESARQYMGQMDTSGLADAVRDATPSSEPSDGTPVEVPPQASPHAPPEASPTVSPATPPAPVVETPTPVGIPAEDTEMQTGAQSAVSDYGRQGMAEMEARQPPRGFEPGPRFDTEMLSGHDEGMERTPEEEALDRLAKPERDAARDAAAGPLPSLDAGLPSEGDIRDARIRGGIGGGLHALGAFISGLGGGRVADFENPATALEQRREQGLERRMQGKATGERERRAAEHQAEQDDIRRQELAFRQRQFDEAYRDRAVAQAEASRAHAGGAEARTAATVEEAAREQADFSEERSPESDFSRIARDRVAGALEDPRRAASLGHAYDDVLARLADDPPTLSARELEPLARAIGVDMPVRGRSGGGTGSGTGGGAGGDRQQLEDAFVAHAVAAAGEDPQAQAQAERLARADVAAMSTEHLRMAHRGISTSSISSDLSSGRAEESFGRAHGEGGEVIMPGVRTAPGVMVSPVERNHIRQQITTAAQSSHALQRLGRIAHRYENMGLMDRAWAVMSPTQRAQTDADARAATSAMMAMVANLEGSGIIGPSDMPRIQAAIPDPNSPAQELLGTLGERIAAFNDAVEYGVRAQLSSRGVSEEGIAEALRVIRGGATHHEGAPQRAPRPSPTEPTAPASAPRRAPPSAEAIQRALEAASRGDR